LLALLKNNNTAILSLPVSDKSIDDLLSKEWLLTNNRGGYASSTIIGCNTRRYHGLLIGSLNPPVDRVMALANCLEMLICNGETSLCSSPQNGNHGNVFNLSTFEFTGKFAPQGFNLIQQFRQDVGVHFDYRLAVPKPNNAVNRGHVQLTKSIYLLRDTDTVALVYDFTSLKEPVEFILRPFIGLRNFHTLQKSYAPLYTRRIDQGLLLRHDTPESCEMFLTCPSANFEKDERWWFNFVYRSEKQRGQDFTEDLWTPGFFKCRIDSPTKIVLWASLSNRYNPDAGIPGLDADVEALREDLKGHQNCVIASLNRAKAKDKKIRTLCLAADQFISRRKTPDKECDQNDNRTTILAGFPWFADWGRDTFVALPGLLLSTGRFDDAKSILISFAQAVDDGLIPNRFDDIGNTAYFNSVDASLWFINAAFQYLNTTGDAEAFTQHLLPIIQCIIDSYHKGSRFGIRADDDGLITAGDRQTQLTWMDAKCDGVAITPRYGKAVEINALWYNALCLVAQFYTKQDEQAAKHYKSMADKVAASFCKLFWNETTGYLNDCVLPDGSADTSLRPNQIYAVSLPFSPLPTHQARCVVDVVQKNLLTPYGLRTLSPQDSRYKSQYSGPLQQRDQAYHQGTVWPYLIGPFVESFLKVNNFSRKSKKKAADFIQPLMLHLTKDGCLGQICEIFDADAPHMPRGCFAQAWSVAELIRAHQLINS
jgi:predicted glycogen debranching enzyme